MNLSRRLWAPVTCSSAGRGPLCFLWPTPWSDGRTCRVECRAARRLHRRAWASLRALAVGGGGDVGAAAVSRRRAPARGTLRHDARRLARASARAHPRPSRSRRPARAAEPAHAESTREQASAGLTALSAAELANFQSLNAAYLARFGFPFIICARLNHRATILAAMQARLGHTPETEFATALAEIEKIAQLRLNDHIGPA